MEVPALSILAAALPVFLLLLLGFVLRRTGTLTGEADGSLLKLVVRVFYPCLLFDFIIGNPALRDKWNLIAAPVLGFSTIVVGFLLGYGLARLLGLRRGSGLRTFAFCNGVYNYGFIPIPVIIALFGARETLGVLFIYNLGIEIAIWTAGIVLLAGKLELVALKRLLNPPLLALLAALLMNFMGMEAHIPKWLSRLISMLGACTIPLGILLAGAVISSLLGSRYPEGKLKVPIASVALRLVLLPAIFVLLAAALPLISMELRQVLIVQAAMPAGVLSIVLSRHYGGDATVAVKVVLTTTLMSVISMPLWILAGLSLLPG